jgi:hypothetical protein
MSKETIDNLRKAFRVANGQGVEAAAAQFEHLLHPEFTIAEAANVPDRENYTGREAFKANLEKLEEAFRGDPDGADRVRGPR